MKHLLNPTVKAIEISGIRKMTEKIKGIPNVISLTIGEPDFHTPEVVKDAGKRAIDDNYTFYAPTAGILSLREEASRFQLKKYGLSYDPNTEVVVTNGSTESIFLALKTILLEDDEVLIPTPTYPGYEPVISMCGGKLIPIDTTTTNFKLTKEQLIKHITPKTKAVILPYPSNPTGAILKENELKELVEILEDREIFIISDELYSELTFEGKHVSIAQFSSVREKTIVINGLSKSHAMTGWRIGFVFAPSYIAQEMLKVHQYVNTSVNTPSQVAGLYGLAGGDESVNEMRNAYKRRRDFLCDGLKDLGFDIVVPEGTFYAFPNISKFHHDAYEFSLELLEKAKIGLLPSTVFTYGGNQHFRISFASSTEKLSEALNRLDMYLKKR